MSEWLPGGQTANENYCLATLAKLRIGVRKRRPELWKRRRWALHRAKGEEGKAGVMEGNTTGSAPR
jgi:hypothetical protein